MSEQQDKEPEAQALTWVQVLRKSSDVVGLKPVAVMLVLSLFFNGVQYLANVNQIQENRKSIDALQKKVDDANEERVLIEKERVQMYKENAASLADISRNLLTIIEESKKRNEKDSIHP